MLTVGSLAAEMGLELVAGRDAADAPIRWVHSSELVDPTPWLSGGELILTTGLQLGSSPTGPRGFTDHATDLISKKASVIDVATK